MNDAQVTIFDIGFTYDIDGPGQRMIVYFKGCNLHCPWCASPESMAANPEVLFYPDRASSKEAAIAACPFGAVSQESGIAICSPKICRSCGTFPCIHSDVPAFEMCGRVVSTLEIIKHAEEYRPFFGSNGGVTIGGGEPTCQFSALRQILSGLHQRSIHTAIETNGTHPGLQDLFPLLDLLLVDLKHPVSERCKGIVGQGNETVLSNIATRWNQGGSMVVRIPLVPGYNADEAAIHEFGKALSSIGRLSIELLPFHRRGEVKWRALGLTMPAELSTEPSKQLLAQVREILQSYGLQIR